MYSPWFILALVVVALVQIGSIRSVIRHPVPVTSTRFLLLRGGWVLLLASSCWPVLGPAFAEWIQPRAGLLVVLGVALFSFVEHLSRHLLFAYSRQWNERAVWLLALVGILGQGQQVQQPLPASWLVLLPLAVIVLVLGTFYTRTKRRADRARWQPAAGTYQAE